MEKISIKNLGPIKSADVEFGDFTLLVGPQASGKSVFLQLVKLVGDGNYIATTLKKYGYVWSNAAEYLELFFGEGMARMWEKQTEIAVDGCLINKFDLVGNISENRIADTVYYVPAQRVLALQNGWPRPFSDYSNDSFILKDFSEQLRTFLEFGPGRLLLPGKEKRIIRDDTYSEVYHGEIEIDVSNRKKIVLNIGDTRLPYTTWSAGQKEFMPLWLSMYMFRHPEYATDAVKKTVIFEEPEMGLHPAAIKLIILELIFLMNLGYKVVVSTHSTMLLEFAWAMQLLKSNNAPVSALQELFDVAKDQKAAEFEKALREKSFKTYYFAREKGIVKDISTLDAGSDDPSISEWGGLSSFASRAAEIVAKNVAL